MGCTEIAQGKHSLSERKVQHMVAAGNFSIIAAAGTMNHPPIFYELPQIGKMKMADMGPGGCHK